LSFDQLQTPRSVVDVENSPATIVGTNNTLKILGDANIATGSVDGPFTTASTTGIMLGLAQTIQGFKSGQFRIVITLVASNDTAGDGFSAQISYDLGAPPAPNAPPTGSAVGTALSGASTAANQPTPITLVAIASANVGATIWVDVLAKAVTGGTASFTDINVYIEEL
jgi:hypothetical protein